MLVETANQTETLMKAIADLFVSEVINCKRFLTIKGTENREQRIRILIYQK